MKKRLCSFLLILCLLIGALPSTAFAYTGESSTPGVDRYYKYTLVTTETDLSSGGEYYKSEDSWPDGFKPQDPFGNEELVAASTTDIDGKLDGSYVYSGPAVVYTLAAITAENTTEYNIGDPLNEEDFIVTAYYRCDESLDLPTAPAITGTEDQGVIDEKIANFNASMAAVKEDTHWYVVTVSAFTLSERTMPATSMEAFFDTNENGIKDAGEETYYIEHGVRVSYGGKDTIISLSEPQQYGLSSISTYGAVVFTNGGIEVTSATAGATVYIEINPLAGYEVVSATTGGGAYINLTSQDGIWSGSFTMEATDTAVTVEYKKADYAVTITEPEPQQGFLQILSGSAVLENNDLNSIPFGTELTVSASALSGSEFILSNIRVEKADGSEIIVNNKKFNMPAGNVKVSAIFAESTPDMQNLNEFLTTPNMTLVDGTYYLTADLTLNGQDGFINNTTETGVKGNGLKIAEGAEVRIYLNGYTLTAIGLDAEAGSNGLAGLNGSGDSNRVARSKNVSHGAGGFAGILLPETSTLYFVGSGTVNAQGGKAGNGGNGGKGGNGTSDVHFPPPINSDDDSSGGGGGQGGGGGGGAGAGIGTNGSAGYTYGESANNPLTAGALIFCEDTQGSITTNVTGGSIGAKGSAGGSGSGSYSKKYMYYPGIIPIVFWDEASAGGGGGGGYGEGGGYGASYGSGGYGGSGGASGTSGGSDHTSTNKDNKMGSVGFSGTVGINGVFGMVAASNNAASNKNYYTDTVKTTTTAFSLKGITVESKFSDVYGIASETDLKALLTDEDGDDAIDVWAYYGNTSASFNADDALDGDYENSENWKVWKLERITKKDGGSVETYTTNVAFASIADAKAEISNTTTATITVTYKPVNHSSIASSVTATDMVGVGKKQAVSKNMAEDYVVVGGGDAVKFNDGKDPLNIAKATIAGSQTAYNQGAAYIVKNYDYKDYKFENSDTEHTLGSLSNTSNKTYSVKYTPYNAYGEVSESAQYILGDESTFYPYTQASETDLTDSLKEVAFRNAGLYEITETWTRHDDKFVSTNPESHINSYKTTYFVVIQQADLEVVNAIDTVTSNTTVQDHTFDRVVVGRNNEQILGQYTFASNQATSTQDTYCYHEDWAGANAQNQSANNITPHITNIAWEFNVKRTYAENDNPFGDRNMNNYLDQNDGTKLSMYKGTSMTIGNTVIDGTTLKADQNTFYSASNGELHYNGTGVTVLKDNDHLTVSAKYEKDQKMSANDDSSAKENGSDNAKTEWANLDSKDNVATTDTITSVYAEDVAFGAKFSNDKFGFRVNANDFVSGDNAGGTHITNVPAEIAVTSMTNDGVTQKATTIGGAALFAKLVDNKKYKGDYYVVSVKDANGKLVKAWEYNDSDDNTPVASNVPSGSEYELIPSNAWDAFNVGTYTVTVEYVGLYYQNATGDTGRQPEWSGTESFNWVTASKSFKLKIEKRNVAYKPLNDLYKVYDSTNLLVKDILSNGDVSTAAAYIIDLDTSCSTATQFTKGLSNIVDTNFEAGNNNDDALYNFLKPVNKTDATTLKLELAGSYDGVDANANLSGSSIKARFAPTTSKDEDNYNLIKVNNQTLSGKIFTAQMHVSHNMTAAVIVHDTTPMRDVLNLHAKAYMPQGRTMSYAASGVNAGYLATPVAFSLQELVSKDDATDTSSVYPANSSTKYDYDADFELILNSKSDGLIYNTTNTSYTHKEDGFKINNGTGAVEIVAKNTSNGSSVDLFPSITLNLKEFKNYVLVKQTENTSSYPSDTYGQCAEGTANGPRSTSYFAVKDGVAFGENAATSNTLTHTLRYSIRGNGDTFNLILPINQLNKRNVLSKFDNKAGEAVITVGEEKYQYVTVYENGDSADFTFTLPQNSYLEDVLVVAIPANTQGKTATMDSSLMPKFANIDKTKLVGKFSSNTSGTISQTYANKPCNLSLELLSVNNFALGNEGFAVAAYFGGSTTNGADYTVYRLAAPNEQIGGSTYTFRLTTGESGLGTEYNLVIVPVVKAYGALLGDNAANNKYASNLSVEKTITSATDKTLVSGTNDYVYVNYKALWDTTAKGSTYGTITLKNGNETTSTDLVANTKDQYYSVGFGTEDNSFFSPEKLVPGTQVDVTLKVWRNGVVSGEQASDDKDVFDTVSFIWTVSDADYFALFGDDVVTFYDGNSRIGYGIIGSGSTTIDFTAVNFIATSGTKTAAKNMKSYTKTNYTVNGWFTNNALTQAVTYTGTPEKYVDISSIKEFYLKSTYNSGSGNTGGGGFSGGGSVVSPVKYSITATGATTDKTKAESGETITIIVVITDGMELKTLKVLDKNNSSVEVNNLGNNTYTFVMPASDVSVSASITKASGASDCQQDETCVYAKYIDANPKAWYHDGLHYCVEKNIFTGTGEKTISPDRALSRGDMITILWKLAGKPVVNYYMTYTDVPAGSYCAEAIRWATAEKIVGGKGNNLFAPFDSITREELATMIYQYEKYKGGGFKDDWAFQQTFEDAEKIHTWAKEAVAWCSSKKIINGSNGQFIPSRSATRAEAAVITYQYLENK